MAPAGIEPRQTTAGHNNNLRDSLQGSAAESGAVGAANADLQEIVCVWPRLPKSVQVRIMSLLKAATETEKP